MENGPSEYALKTIIKLGPYTIDFLRRKYWTEKNLRRLPLIIVNKKMKDGSFRVSPYFK